jgi:hypothetical protein
MVIFRDQQPRKTTLFTEKHHVGYWVQEGKA